MGRRRCAEGMAPFLYLERSASGVPAGPASADVASMPCAAFPLAARSFHAGKPLTPSSLTSAVCCLCSGSEGGGCGGVSCTLGFTGAGESLLGCSPVLSSGVSKPILTRRSAASVCGAPEAFGACLAFSCAAAASPALFPCDACAAGLRLRTSSFLAPASGLPEAEAAAGLRALFLAEA